MDASLLLLTIEKLQDVPNEYDEAEVVLQIIPILVFGDTDLKKRLDLDWENIQGIRIARKNLVIPEQFLIGEYYPQVWIRPVASNLYIPIGISILTSDEVENNIKWVTDETNQDELIPALVLEGERNNPLILNAPVDTEELEGYTLYSDL